MSLDARHIYVTPAPASPENTRSNRSVSTSSPRTTDSPQVKLVRSFIEGFKRGDVDHLAEHLHEDHRRITYPGSIGKPVQTREEWLQHTADFIAICTDSCEVSSRIYLLNPPSPDRSHN